MRSRRHVLQGLALLGSLASTRAPGSVGKLFSQKGNASMPKILMITTSADRMTPGDEPTGLWLEELTTPITPSGMPAPR